MLIAALWARYGRRTVEVAAAWRQCRRQSEPAYFAKLSSACRTGDAVAVHRALQLWVLRAGIRPLDRWAYRFGAPRLRVEIAGLERDLFSRRPTAGGWTNRSLIAELAAARRNWRGARTGVTRRVLPDLN